MKNSEYNEILVGAIDADHQASANPARGLAVDPDVAEVMGAFEENALTLDDLDEVDDGEE